MKRKNIHVLSDDVRERFATTSQQRDFQIVHDGGGLIIEGGAAAV